MKKRLEQEIIKGLKEIPKYPYNSMPYCRYFSTILNPPELDGLFLVHPNCDIDKFEKIDKSLIH